MTVKVFFVKDSDGITAVFPYELGNINPLHMSCYAHMGQHSSCCTTWVEEQQKAQPSEFAELLAELTQVYNDCKLQVLARFPAVCSYQNRFRQLQNR